MEKTVQIALHADSLTVVSFLLYLIIIVAAGILSAKFSSSVTILWNQISLLKNIIYELVPAFIVSSFLTILISFLTAQPKEAEEELRLIRPKYRF